MDLQYYRDKTEQLLACSRGEGRTMDQRCEDAIVLAALWLEWGNSVQTSTERSVGAELARMMKDPQGKAFTTSMTDQCFRSSDRSRVADQLLYLLDKFGIPQFLALPKRAGMLLFKLLGQSMSGLLVPQVKKLLRRESQRVILPGESGPLSDHLRARRAQGVRINLNHLGEAILGEEEAQRRLQLYLDDLARPEVDYISVKISTICSQLNLLDWDYTLHLLSQRLRMLYRASMTEPPKFVNLDMEEYSDLRLTLALFQRVLDEPEFLHLSAGVVLQAYIPDSYACQKQLTQWALRRVAAGGAPVKIRIVKGANLAMEQVIASLHGWEQAPYADKSDVDANFKRMVMYGLMPEHAQAVHIGIGSHNLFDIAFAMLLREEGKLEDKVTFEMLEGMADHLRRVVQETAGDMLLYCPAATESEFQNAIAYLIRRLDENTAPKNFLRHVFGMTPGSQEWNEQTQLFKDACEKVARVSDISRRVQNRGVKPTDSTSNDLFVNEPDTDWALTENRLWIEEIVKGGASETYDTLELMPWATLNAVLALAVHTKAEWASRSPHDRAGLLAAVACVLRRRRAEFMRALIYTCGKVAQEADVEFQEAIDFVEYYRHQILNLEQLEDIAWSPKGVVLVAPPWNFPCSIPIGGVAAALAAGNCVLLKPAPEAAIIGTLIAQAFWEGGIGRDVLQLIVCDDDTVGSILIQDERVDTVILTGATETARLLLRLRPGLDLLAETGGKNALIVTRMADRDLAVRDVIQSAFGHAGQKCSACSLLICEAEVYDDPQFRRQLRDAAASWRTGPSWELGTRLSPLIRPAEQHLLRALTTLEEGEEWLLEPHQDPDNPLLWSAGIKIGVTQASHTFRHELFGPVLGVMRAENLQDAITLANRTPYGLTSGLHSLDIREQQLWIDQIQAGNLYVNRGITGAVVQRQPFGGSKDSSFGPGAKAGGPNYLVNLMHATQAQLPQDRQAVRCIAADFASWVVRHLTSTQRAVWDASVGSYSHYWCTLFSQQHDPSCLIGQDNYLRYRPHPCTLRVQEDDAAIDVWRVCVAALICGAPLEISMQGNTLFLEEDPHQWGITVIDEDEATFTQRIKGIPFARVRLLRPASPLVTQELALMGARVLLGPVLANGRLELLRHLREVSLSIDYHRYGNLGERENKKHSSQHPGSLCNSCPN